MTAAELLQRLIRFDTRNPPGAERACVVFIKELLDNAGLETIMVAGDPERPNLIARLPGSGAAAPLLLQGHVDVAPTTGQDWSRDPLGGELVDGWIWGRGALDMKGGVAMMVHAVLAARLNKTQPAGDIVLAVLSDEEQGGTHGAKLLVTKRPDLLTDVRYAIGEFGGFSMQMAGRRFYPIQVTEKQRAAIRVSFKGAGGHGSTPVTGEAMAKLGRFLLAIDRHALPMHMTPVVRLMIDAMASELACPRRLVLRSLQSPRFAGATLLLLGQGAQLLRPLLHNTVSATAIHGNGGHTVIPSSVSVDLDARLLPGIEPPQLLRELRAVGGPDASFELLHFDRGPPEPDLGLFDLLAGVLREADPTGAPIPMLLPAVTDARHFARLGIQGYGFTPLLLPHGFRVSRMVHAADERVPTGAIEWGAERLMEVLRRYGR